MNSNALPAETEEKQIRQLLEKHIGIHFDRLKLEELRQDLAIRIAETGSDYDSYLRLLQSSPARSGELQRLINLITTNETFFFRVEEHMELLRKVVVPDLLSRQSAGPIRIWSAGCSSGEEAYSIAIAMLEATANQPLAFEVLGTDINDDMLYVAGKGIYSGRTLNHVSPQRLQNYFEPFLDRYRVAERVKKCVRFEHLNLAQPFGDRFPCRQDIIFFRNVLIYLGSETVARIIPQLEKILADDGYLFLGPSESLWRFAHLFDVVLYPDAFLYRKKDQSHQGAIHPAVPPTRADKAKIKPRPDQSKLETSQAIQQPSEDRIGIMLEESELMVELGDYTHAETILNEVLRLDEKNRQATLWKLLILSNRGRKEELLAAAQEAEKKFPIFAEMHYLLGRFYESLGKIAAAQVEFKKVLFIDQALLPPRQRLLLIWRKLGETGKARREAQNILDRLSSGKWKPLPLPGEEGTAPDALRQICRETLLEMEPTP
jgi:chemotaxis protein methyltransferase CheR